jgi:hypothetical protein
MPATTVQPGTHPIRDGPVGRVGRFALHFLEMCAVMCVGAIALNVLFFGTAYLLGQPNLSERLPEVAALAVAVSLSLPMAGWMRYRGMAMRPTLEMSGATMTFGLLLIGGYQLGLVSTAGLIELQARFACPLMLAVMLFRFGYYAQGHHAHTRHAPAAVTKP